MKRIYYFALFIASIVIFALTSCSQDLDYRKACEEKDFAKAYQIVDLLKEDAAQKKADWKSGPSILNGDYETFKNKQLFDTAQEKAEEAEKYVVLQESMMLLENGDNSSLMRIVAIAKEHDADSWLFDELIDIARKIGDDELVKRLKKMNSSDLEESGDSEE